MPYLKKTAPSPEPIDCRILTAALDLFVSNGYHSVSIHEIQKQAEVSIGSIYKHFGGKEGVAKALYKHILNEVDELIDDVIDTVDSPTEQCKTIIKQLFDYTESHSNIIAFAFHAKHAEFLPEEPPICDAIPFIKIRQIIQAAMDCGELKQTDAFVASSVLFGGALRMIQLRLDQVIDTPLPNYYDTIIQASWNGLSVEQTPPKLKVVAH